MGFALALLVVKKRRLLGENGPASRSGLVRVLIWLAGLLSIVSLIVSGTYVNLMFLVGCKNSVSVKIKLS